MKGEMVAFHCPLPVYIFKQPFRFNDQNLISKTILDY